MSVARDRQFLMLNDDAEYRRASFAAARDVANVVQKSVAVVNKRVAILDAAMAAAIAKSGHKSDMASKLSAFDSSEFAVSARKKIEKARKVAVNWQRFKISKIDIPWYGDAK